MNDSMSDEMNDESTTCYFCNEKDLRDNTWRKLFDGRIVCECWECYRTNEESLEFLRSKNEN